MIEQWIETFSGQGRLSELPIRRGRCQIGHHQFPPLTSPKEPPVLDSHYFGILDSGPVQVAACTMQGTRRRDAAPGQVFFVPAGLTVSWQWDRPTSESQIFVSPALLTEVAQECGLSNPVPYDGVFLEDETLVAMAAVVARIAKTPCASSGVPLGYALRAMLAHFILSSCAKDVEASRRSTRLSTGQVRRICTFAQDNMEADISLDDLAAHIGMSKFHFARAFRATIGETPHGWLSALRLARARNLLLDSETSILEIANTVGFESQSHFGLMFRRAYGKSPSQFRRDAS